MPPPRVPPPTLRIPEPEAEHLDRLLPAGGALEGRVFSRLMQPPADALPAGTEIGGWRLDKPLGSGGSSTVYLAERSDRRSKLQVALKVVRAKRALIEQCRREREILRTLDHPSIVGLIDGDEIEGGHAWLAMEPVFGERIDQHVATRKLDLAERLDLFEEVCDAVAHVHGRHWVHCDIKPGNLLVDRTGRPRLLDFGIAVKEGAQRSSRYLAMTPIYASPEQRGGHALTAASDIYQLGALLNAIVDVGAVVDPGAERAGLLLASHADLSDIDAIIRRATARDPAHRFPCVAVLKAEIAAARRRGRVRP